MSWLLILITCLSAQAAMPPVDNLPIVEALPDPFLFQDGRRVASPEEWPARRAEILDLVLGYQYGSVPPAPGNVEVAEVVSENWLEGETVLHRVVRIQFGPQQKISTVVHIYIPKSDKPVPVLVRCGIDDFPASFLTQRAYAYACYDHKALDPDTEGHDIVGPAQSAYPDYDWGSLGVWAWGLSRVLDYAVTLPEIDGDRAAVTGHSRTGKTALLAGALDERFKVVAPNGSGCGGASIFRDPPEGVETLKLITLETRFKAWFKSDFGQFSDKETRLPFDQHFMRALIAPRVCLDTDALADTWANPPGAQIAWHAAQPVFDFLGVPENNLCHFRDGKHDQLITDYQVLADVLDWHFRDKTLATDFSTRPIEDFTPTWTWKAPSP